MPAQMKSQFARLIEDERFDDAASLLKANIKEAGYVNPLDDYSWGPESDDLGYAILDKRGAEAFCAYWEDFLRFFTEELEPAWGHLHKGHIYFRLGLGHFAIDRERAADYLVLALEEDRLVADSFAPTLNMEPEALVHRFPSYVTLAMTERFEESCFASSELWGRFFKGLAQLRFDVIWDKKEVEPTVARGAINALVPAAARELVISLHAELATACAMQQPASPLPLVSALAETIIFARLYHAKQIETIDGLDIVFADRSSLFDEARKQGIFPSDVVWATFEMTHLMDTVLRRPSTRQYEYAITPQISFLIGYALKILLDRALVLWSEAES